MALVWYYGGVLWAFLGLTSAMVVLVLLSKSKASTARFGPFPASALPLAGDDEQSEGTRPVPVQPVLTTSVRRNYSRLILRSRSTEAVSSTPSASCIFSKMDHLKDLLREGEEEEEEERHRKLLASASLLALRWVKDTRRMLDELDAKLDSQRYEPLIFGSRQTEDQLCTSLYGVIVRPAATELKAAGARSSRSLCTHLSSSYDSQHDYMHSDVFSYAVVLFEMLKDKVPRSGPPSGELFAAAPGFRLSPVPLWTRSTEATYGLPAFVRSLSFTDPSRGLLPCISALKELALIEQVHRQAYLAWHLEEIQPHLNYEPEPEDFGDSDDAVPEQLNGGNGDALVADGSVFSNAAKEASQEPDAVLGFGASPGATVESETGGGPASSDEDEAIPDTNSDTEAAPGSPDGAIRALRICPEDLIKTLDFEGSVTITIPIQLWDIKFQAVLVTSPRLPFPANVRPLTPVAELTPHHQDFGMNVLVTLPLLTPRGPRACIHPRRSFFLVLEEGSDKWEEVEGGNFSHEYASLKMKCFCQLVGVEGPSTTGTYELCCQAWIHPQAGPNERFGPRYNVKLLVYDKTCRGCQATIADQQKTWRDQGFQQCLMNGGPMEVSFPIKAKDMLSNGFVELRFCPFLPHKGCKTYKRDYENEPVEVPFSLPLDPEGCIRYSIGAGKVDDVEEVVFSMPSAFSALYVHTTSTKKDLAHIPREWRAIERFLPSSQAIWAKGSDILDELNAKLDSGRYELLIFGSHRTEDAIIITNGNKSSKGHQISNEALEVFLRQRLHEHKTNPNAIHLSTCGGGKLARLLVDPGIILFAMYWENKPCSEEGVPDELAASFTEFFVQKLSQNRWTPGLQHESVLLYRATFHDSKRTLLESILHDAELRDWHDRCCCYRPDPHAFQPGEGTLTGTSTTASSASSLVSCFSERAGLPDVSAEDPPDLPGQHSAQSLNDCM